MGIYNKLVGQTAPVQLNIPRNNDEALRLTEALRVLDAHVMIADEHDVIIDMNESVERMLRHAEPAIRTELPHFDVDSLRGTSMDVFHRHPAHQKQLLANLRAPHRASVKLGGREFLLVATPLWNADRRLGTVIEWQDLTEMREFERREAEQRQREQARHEELSVITTALDSVSSNVMMADNDGRIFFANRAVLALLRNAEADLCSALPDFRVDTLIGRNFDCFHRQPAHQRNLLAQLKGPHQASISVAGRQFQLLAAPVFSADGKRLATVVEWQDRTLELQMERDIENTIQAAIVGDLDARIDGRGYAGFIGKIANGINQLLDVFDTVLTDTGAALQALAAGRLGQHLERDYQGRYLTLKTDIDTTNDRLMRVIGDIADVTGVIEQVTGELNTAGSNLSQRTEEQAASLEETSAAMTELVQSVQQSTQEAESACSLAKDACRAAEEGDRVLNQTIGAMRAISESSRRIEEIIGTIDSIAFQTNLLALNAAVEAARAGDHGRGFAVVAGEVRNLAGMSAKAAKEIKTLIRDSTHNVREGESLVERSGATLAQIGAAVQKVSTVVEAIAGSGSEQSRGLHDIDSALQEIDTITQQNAAMVVEASETSEALHQRAEALRELLAFFTITGR